jgi:Papain-like cysteine protease AvrRpt2
MDRNLERVDKAVQDKLITPEQGRALTEQSIRSASGKGAATKPPPSATPAVKKAIERASASESGSVKVSRPAGSVEVTTGDAGPMNFDVSPAVAPIQQPSPNTCWAAGGAMLMSWKRGVSLSIQEAADAAGAGWRAKLDSDQPLTASDVKVYAKAMGMSGESPMCYLPRGLLRLLRDHGPLWVIGDDAVDGNRVVHVRMVTGMHGDGTSDGTQVHYLDPADGTSHHESFTAFSRHLEAADASSLSLGISTSDQRRVAPHLDSTVATI